MVTMILLVSFLNLTIMFQVAREESQKRTEAEARAARAETR